MAEAWLNDHAADRLDALENDPTRPHLASAVLAAVQRIAADPGDARVRRLRYQAVDAWGVAVSGDGEDWIILWKPHPTKRGVILVPYVGPAGFI